MAKVCRMPELSHGRVDATDTLVGASEAARLLGVTTRTLHRWEADGKISPTRTLGGQRRYSLAEIERINAGIAPEGGGSDE